MRAKSTPGAGKEGTNIRAARLFTTGNRVVSWGTDYHGSLAVPAGLSNVVFLACGSGHTLAQRNDGSLIAWGDNDYGESTIPAGLTQVITVAAGGWHSLALNADGTVTPWGLGYYGQSEVPAGLSNVMAVADGYRHCLALKADGTVAAWGNNYSGQITVPEGLSNVVEIAEENTVVVEFARQGGAQAGTLAIQDEQTDGRKTLITISLPAPASDGTSAPSPAP